MPNAATLRICIGSRCILVSSVAACVDRDPAKSGQAQVCEHPSHDPPELDKPENEGKARLQGGAEEVGAKNMEEAEAEKRADWSEGVFKFIFFMGVVFMLVTLSNRRKP